MNRLWVFRLSAALAAGIVIVILLAINFGSGGESSTPSATPLPGTLYDPPQAVSDFTLTSQTGEPLHLSDLRGKAVVIFFGYTNCPDVCPTTLADFKRVKTHLGADVGRVTFVFISVDGARDTPERLAAYVGAFDPEFIGLMGDDATIRTIAKDYGVFFQQVAAAADNPNYLVDHTASSFVVDPQGRLALVFPYQADALGMAQRIRDVLRAS